MPFSSTDRVMLRLILPIEGDCRLWNRSARFISIKVRVRNWVRRSDGFFLGPKKEKMSYLSGCVSLVEMHSIARRFALEIDVYHVFDCGDLDTDRLQSMTVLSATEVVTCHEPIRARIATSEKNHNPIINFRERKEKRNRA